MLALGLGLGLDHTEPLHSALSLYVSGTTVSSYKVNILLPELLSVFVCLVGKIEIPVEIANVNMFSGISFKKDITSSDSWLLVFIF